MLLTCTPVPGTTTPDPVPFEQVTDAAPQIAELLGACPNLKVLSTSRSSLRLRWEHEVAVPPLQVPELRPLPSLDELPFPEHKAMLNLHGYSRALMADMAGDIVASRGCPHDCTFCSVMNVWGRSVRWRTRTWCGRSGSS